LKFGELDTLGLVVHSLALRPSCGCDALAQLHDLLLRDIGPKGPYGMASMRGGALQREQVRGARGNGSR
jgi:hypothetical protein